jgi:hypothetical protein
MPTAAAADPGAICDQNAKLSNPGRSPQPRGNKSPADGFLHRKEAAMPAQPQTPEPREPNIPDPELLEDGQEEVFSRTAVEHGIVKDPRAIGPENPEDDD